jgi:acetyl esterase
MKISFLSFFIILFFVITVNGQYNYPPQNENIKRMVYKDVDGLSLNLWLFNPPNHEKTNNKPAIVFFFGGGWQIGNPSQFIEHCKYLAGRGMVAMVADYRVKQRHNVLANKCVFDAKSAIRWIREHASELGIDQNRIIAGGGSAGGHLAASTGILPNFDEPNENSYISSKPNALVLFNPALVLATVDDDKIISEKKADEFKQLMGVEPIQISPYHHIKSGLPPTIIFHGTDDSKVPFNTIEIFQKKMKESGNICVLVAYEGEEHGFFNYGRDNNSAFIDSVNKLDKFLVKLGYIKAPPESIIIK